MHGLSFSGDARQATVSVEASTAAVFVFIMIPTRTVFCVRRYGIVLISRTHIGTTRVRRSQPSTGPAAPRLERMVRRVRPRPLAFPHAVRRESSTTRPRSPSIDLLKKSLEAAAVSRRTFVNETGLSYEYVSRIFNSKVKFPAVRETLEKFAEVARIDPMVFVEYQQLVSVLPKSDPQALDAAAKAWPFAPGFPPAASRSRAPTCTRSAGDVPSPRNPEVIEKIALAAEMAPESFAEYLAPVQDWAERNPGAIEQVFINLLVTKMLLARGYASHETPAKEISDEMVKDFAGRAL